MILLDTHALIWYATGDPRLSPKARTLIGAPGNCYRAASIWEAAIKSGIGKLDFAAEGKTRSCRRIF